ncbi:hypothetical protein Xph01_22290 [Micromonospora phaseoli]|nr:hypothetical protein Xph01_22290 [Micromonospora phaseoli]
MPFERSTLPQPDALPLPPRAPARPLGVSIMQFSSWQKPLMAQKGDHNCMIGVEWRHGGERVGRWWVFTTGPDGGSGRVSGLRGWRSAGAG